MDTLGNEAICGTSCGTDADGWAGVRGGNDILVERAGQSDPGTRGAPTPAVGGGRTLRVCPGLREPRTGAWESSGLWA